MPSSIPSTYVQISTILTDVAKLLRPVPGFLNDAVTAVVTSTDETKEDILYDFYRASKDAIYVTALSEPAKRAIRKLSQFAIESEDVGTLNEFLVANDIKVSQEYADLSAESGFPIDASNIGETLYQISGTICSSGTPVPGITVEIFGTKRDGSQFYSVTTTASDGTYSLSVPNGLVGTINPSSDDYSFEEASCS